MAESIEGLIYAEAQCGPALQPTLVNELRARTGILLGVTGATTAFLGAIVVDKTGLHDWGALALAAFVVAVGCCGAVLSPHRKWKFFESPARLTKTYRDSKDSDGNDWTPERFQREVALWMEKHADQAIESMKAMQKWYLGAGSSLAVEIGCWLIAYAD